MFIIKIIKMDLTGGRIGIMLYKQIAKLEFSGGHIKNMLYIEIASM